MSTSHDPNPTPEVWVVITQDPTGRITDLEILDQAPAWDLAGFGQTCRVGNVNGGDSVPFAGREV